jgi:DmsE family decaheme c-type cytochrome
MRLIRPSVMLAGLLILFGGLQAAAQASPQSWSATDCQTCHEKAASPAFNKTAHAKLDQSCASCHQNVAEHIQGQMAGDEKAPKPSVKGLKAEELNNTCLTCHEKSKQAAWRGGVHDRRQVACTTCHSVHAFESKKAQLKTEKESESCFSCHQTMRAKSQRTSHHPVREGKMECSSCHNPHDGSRPQMLKAESVNELCYTCHAEKRGPFLFEHAPVREDCISCHDAHGSNHKRMLVQKLPNLCWNCHLTGSGHFGSGDNLSTELGARVAPPGAPSGYPTANARWVEKSCKNCHTNIHGSNSPSGAYFVR